MIERDWEMKENPERLERSWSFKNYDQVFDFVSNVVAHSKHVNHHPEITFGYRFVKISIITHDQNKVTDKDHDFVKAINQLWEQNHV